MTKIIKKESKKSKSKVVRLVAILLCLVLCMTMIPFAAFADDTDIIDSGTCGADGDNLTWTLDSDGTLTISGEGDMDDYTNLGSDGMSYPWNSYRSGGYAFKSVIVEEGVTRVGAEAFSFSSYLKEVYMADSVTSIGKCAFQCDTKLSSVTLSNNLTTIDRLAFSDCTALTSIEIPSSVSDIGCDAFSLCSSLTGFSVDSNNTAYCAVDGVLFTIDMKHLVCFPCGNEATSYSVPEDVYEIDQFAFYDCSLVEINIPDSVVIINSEAFMNCYNLVEVNIPDSVYYISDCLFQNDSNLTSVNLSNNILWIGDSAFYGCTSLTNLFIPDKVYMIANNAFYKDSITLSSYCDFGELKGSTAKKGYSAFNDLNEYCNANSSGITKLSFSSIHTGETEEVKENETDTSYDLVTYCSACGEELSRETVTLDASDTLTVYYTPYVDGVIDEDKCMTETNDSYSYDSSDIYHDSNFIDYSSILFSLKEYASEGLYVENMEVYIDDSNSIMSSDNPINYYFTYSADENGIDVSVDWGRSTYPEGTEEGTADVYVNIYLTTTCPNSKDDYVLIDSKDATCTEDGYNTYHCYLCGDEYTDTITATGHVWDDGVVTKEATATTDGEKTYTCTKCGETKAETISATGYTWNDNIYVDDELSSTIEDMGYDEITLDDDSLKEFAEIALESKEQGLYLEKVDFTTTDENSYLNDIVITITYSATNEDGTTTLSVNAHADNLIDGIEDYSADGDVYVNFYFYTTCPHDYKLIDSKDVSTMEDGYNVYHCYICGDEYTDTFSSTGFDVTSNYYLDGELTSSTTTHTTTKNGKASNGVSGILLTSDGIIDLALDVLQGQGLYVQKLDFEYADADSPLNDISVIVTWSGDENGVDCAVEFVNPFDGQEDFAFTTDVVYNIYVSTCPHDYKLINTVNPTCADDGYNTYHCYICGDEYNETISKTGEHSYDNGTITTAATCTTDGVRTYTCTVCGATKTETISATGHTPGSTVIENNVAATKDTDGSYDEVVYCTVCGAELSRNTVATSASGYTVDINGYVDGELVYNDSNKYSIYSFDLSEDNFQNVILGYVKQALVDDGLFVTEISFSCDDSSNQLNNIYMTFDYSADEVSYSIHGDLYNVYEGVDDYAVTDDASMNWYFTTSCPHNYMLTDSVTATCGTDGYNTYHCYLCGDEYTDYISATGNHTEGAAMVTNEVEATCTTDGYKEWVIHCAVCNAIIDSGTDVIPATGHTYTSAVTREATCTEEGIITYTCVNGDDTYTEFIPMIAHTEGTAVKENVVEATAEHDGSYDLVIYCTVCGTELSRETITVPYENTHEGETPTLNEGTFTPATDDTEGSYEVTYDDGTTEERTIPEGNTDDPVIHDDTVVEPTDDTDGSVIVTMPDDKDVIVEIPSGTIPDYVPDTYIPATEDEDGSYTVTYPTDVGDVTVEHTIPAGTEEEPTADPDTLVPPTDTEDGSVIVTMPDGDDVKVTIPSGTEPEYKQDDDGNWYEEYPSDLGDLDVEIPTYNPDTFTPATETEDGSYAVTYPDGTTEERIIDAGDTDDPIVHDDTFVAPTDDTDGSVIVTMPDGKDVVVVMPAGTEPEYKQDDDGNWVEVYPSDLGDIEIEIPILTPDTYTPSTDDLEGSYNVTYKDGTDEDRTIEAGNDKEIEVHTDTFVAPTDDTDSSVIVTMPDDKDVMVVIPSGTEGTYKVDDDGNTVIVYPTEIGDIEIPVDLPTYTPDTFVPATETEDGSYTVVLPDGTVEERTIPAGNTDDPIIHDETFVEPTEDTNGSVVVTMPDGEDVIVEIPAGTIPDYVEGTYVPATDDTDGSYDVIYHTDVGDVRITITIPAGTEGEPTFDMDSFVAPTDTEDGYVYVTMPDGKVVKYVIVAGTEGTLTQLDDGSWVTVYSTDFGDLNVPSDYTGDADSDDTTTKEVSVVEAKDDGDNGKLYAMSWSPDSDSDAVEMVDTGSEDNVLFYIGVLGLAMACAVVLVAVNKRKEME